MGILRELNELSERNKQRKQEREERKKQVNQSPTEEQLKDNKNGKLAYLWTFFSIVAYVLGFGLVFAAWGENAGVGILALILALSLTPMVHTKAVNYARKQRKINGKGLFALIIATLLPAAVLAFGFFFFVFGGMYIWI